MYAVKFVCVLLAMGAVYTAPSDNKNNALGNIIVKNLSGFKANLLLEYSLMNEFVFANMGPLPIGENKTLPVPLLAENINLLVQGHDEEKKKLVTVCSEYIPIALLNKCYQISGSLQNPICMEFACPKQKA